MYKHRYMYTCTIMYCTLWSKIILASLQILCEETEPRDEPRRSRPRLPALPCQPGIQMPCCRRPSSAVLNIREAEESLTTCKSMYMCRYNVYIYVYVYVHVHVHVHVYVHCTLYVHLYSNNNLPRPSCKSWTHSASMGARIRVV